MRLVVTGFVDVGLATCLWDTRAQQSRTNPIQQGRSMQTPRRAALSAIAGSAFLAATIAGCSAPSASSTMSGSAAGAAGNCGELYGPRMYGRTIYEVERQTDQGEISTQRILQWGWPQSSSLGVAYKGHSCVLSLARDIKSIESVKGRDAFDIELVRGQTTRLDLRSVQRSLSGWVVFSPNQGQPPQRTFESESDISGILQITVRHDSELPDDEVKALETLAAADAQAKRQEAEQERIAVQKAVDEERQRQERAATLAAQREAAAAAARQAEQAVRQAERAARIAQLTSPSSVGMQVCKNTRIELVLPYNFPPYVGPGTIVASLEGSSPDQQRVQVRIVSAASPGRLSYVSASAADWVLRPGMLYWDRVDDWHFCEVLR